MNLKHPWAICLLSLTAAVILAWASKSYQGKATVELTHVISGREATRAMAANVAVQADLHVAGILGSAGLVAELIGCFAWYIFVKRGESHTVVVPICLIAAYLMLSLMMV